MISESIQSIIKGLENYKENDIYGEDKGPLINVNRITGQMSTFYEKVRYVIDYKEEHTVRRSAVERILKRKITQDKPENVGLSLLEEMVASGYLLNKSIPETVAHNVNIIVDKYLFLCSAAGADFNRVVSLMATEVERFLYPQTLNDLVVESFYQNVSKNVNYQGELGPEALTRQIYLATRRSLLDEDYDTSFYFLLTKRMPEIVSASDKAELNKLAPTFLQNIHEIEVELENLLGWSVTNRLKNYSVYFSVIRELVRKHGSSAESIFEDKAVLQNEIETLLAREYTNQFDLIDKSGKRAVVYILLTKVILAFALELPFEKFILNEVNYFALTTNVVFHPLLLLVIVRSVPAIYSDNTSNVVKGVTEIVDGKNTRPIYVRPQVARGFLRSVFDTIYLALFLISFGLILWLLSSLGFNIVSILLFLFFLTLVSYFGFRIHHNAKKWRLEYEDESILGLLWTFFTIPIIRTGRWLSKKFSSVNIFIFIMDFIIETPFKLILGTFNSFITFVKEKREDPY